MIEIVKGIPYKNSNSGLPFEKMDVGDSFLIPKEMLYTTVRVRAIQFAKTKKSKHKFSIKKVENGYRCWRIN